MITPAKQIVFQKLSSFNMTDSDSWQPKAVVFDLLTALLDSWDSWAKATPTQTTEEGRRWRSRYLDLTFGAGAYTPATSYEALIRRAADEVGLPQSAADALLREWTQLQPWPEVPCVLQTLKSRGFKIGVVTNCSKPLGHAAVERVEQCVGNDFRFDSAVTAEESGFYKPVKAAYDFILTEMGLTSSEVLFVAGSAGDVQGASDAGMQVVWHNQVGLARKGQAVPLREGSDLQDTLAGFL